MNFKVLKTSELIWDLDFKPRRPWPDCLPVICVENETPQGAPLVAAGFDRQNQDQVATVIVSGKTQQILAQLWPEDTLETFEKLRLSYKLKQDIPCNVLLTLSLPFQNYCDDRRLALKALQPLVHMTDWWPKLEATVLSMNISSSQLRELFDVLCDLKMAGVSWETVSLSSSQIDSWLKTLKNLKNPLTANRDVVMSNKVKGLPLPKGAQAQWSRQGDQGMVTMQVKLVQPLDWPRVKKQLQSLELGEDFWTTETSM